MSMPIGVCRQIYGTTSRARTNASYTVIKTLILTLCILCSALALPAQTQMYRITFRDKGPDSFVEGSVAYQQALLEFSPRALERRALHGKQPLLDTADQPLYAPYLALIEGMGIHTMAPVRLRNCVIALMTAQTAQSVRELPCVQRVQLTKERAYEIANENFECEPRRYGNNNLPHYLIGVLPLQQAGVLGQDVIVGILDNGFRDREHSSLAHLDVLGRYDVVEDQPADLNGHGTIITSIIAGNAQDTLIGIAPYASYLLARSEDQRFERRQEEDNFCAAIEWVERNGADIMTASIGYREFDDTEEQAESFDDFDGHTTFPAVSVNRAVALGLTCVTAVGNKGPDPRTLMTPADADSVIAVGGVDAFGVIWTPTSHGPTASGTIKPDVVALSAHVLSMGLGTERYIYSDGTSNATPQVAGGLALLKQLYPHARTYELRQAMYATAEYPTTKNVSVGHGIPNFTNAARSLGPSITSPSVIIENNEWTLVFVCFDNLGTELECLVRTKSGTTAAVTVDRRSRDWYSCVLDSLKQADDTLEVRLIAHNTLTDRMAYYPSDSTWYKITSQIRIACGAAIPDYITGVDNDASDDRPFEGEGMAHTAHVSALKGRVLSARSNMRVALPIAEPVSVTIVDMLGRTISLESSSTADAPYLDIPALTHGWYILSVSNGLHIYTIPLIIEE